MIDYKVTRWEPKLNCSTHPAGDKVHSVLFGLQATNTETGTSAYVDDRIVLDPCLSPEELNARAEELCEKWAGAKGFYMTLQKALFAKDVAPRPMPSDYKSPNFEEVTIGDGYREFVIDDKNVNDQEIVEEVFSDALPPKPTDDPDQAE